MTSRARTFVTLGLALLLFAIAGATAGASGLINVVNPQSTANSPPGSSDPAPAIPPPLIPAPGGEYVSQQAGTPIRAQDGLPVAQLRVPPTDLPNVEVRIPTRGKVGDDEIAYRMLATVRYAGDGHRVEVTTFQPSAKALQQPTWLGNQMVQLEDGSEAYLTTGLSYQGMPNRVAQARGELIIAIAGDVPIDRLQTLMTEVVVR